MTPQNTALFFSFPIPDISGAGRRIFFQIQKDNFVLVIQMRLGFLFFSGIRRQFEGLDDEQSLR